MKVYTLLVAFVFAFSALHAQPITLLTYNIRFDNPADGDDAWPKRRSFLARQIRFHAPDVFGIQEGLKHQLDYLQEQLPGYAYVGVGRDDGREAGEYTALFYRTDRFRVVESGTFWLSETPDTVSRGWDAALPRICTSALLEDTAAGRKIRVFNTHFDHIGQAARRASAELILQKIREQNSAGHPVVLLGDFNAGPGSDPIRVITGELHDTRYRSQEPAFGPTGTFNGFRFKEPVELCIDYVFVSPDLSVQKFAVLSDSRDCHYPSDHLPVLVRIQ
ncbi:MAG: endonuclease/exonuclease/phosphatase family protein [Lewinellaceae bacterium]|nr:endonuclease/exonuclease/phosphatase family protein [Lewinellaceae bacterium]